MNPAWIRAMEIELQRQAVISLIVFIVLFAIATWVLYFVIKSAIRDGIRESGLLDRTRTTWTAAVHAANSPDTIPHMHDMRAER